MSEQAVLAAVMVGLALVVMATAALIVFRRMASQPQWPAVLAALSIRQRRRAMHQIRKGAPVADDELAGVRTVAVEAAAQRHLALLFAGIGVVFAAQALSSFFPPALRIIYAVAAGAQVLVALVFLYTSTRARRFLAEHPDADVLAPR